MGRFDRTQPLEEVSKGYQATDSFLVDNNQLKSDGRGLAFRQSMNLKDKSRKIAEFGTVVRGVVHHADGIDWLQVDELFLPLKVGDAEVLLRTWWEDPSAEIPSKENKTERQTEGFPSPPEVRSLVPGSGAEYEVVSERLVIRTAPHPQAPMQGTRRKGQTLELFDWDYLRSWRRIRTALGAAWVALDSNEHGPMLRPKGVPFSKQPLDPLCQAAREGNAQDVERFLSEGLSPNSRDAASFTALMLAAQRDGWQGVACCVLLLEANADATLTSSQLRDLEPELSNLEREKRAAVEREDFAEAAALKEKILQLKNGSEQRQTAISLGGSTAAVELLKSLENETFDAAKLHEAFDEMRAMPSVKNIPSRVEHLLQAQGPKRSVQAADPTSEAEEPEAPILRSPVGEVLRGVLFRVLQKAPVFEEASMSSSLLGHLAPNQQVEVLEYSRTRCFGRVEVVLPSKAREKGWLLLEDELLGDLVKALRR